MFTGLVIWLLVWLYGNWFGYMNIGLVILLLVFYMVIGLVIWLLVWLYGYWFGYMVTIWLYGYWFGY